ncbi:hypothetical protein [uncultured Methanosphaera sp.]|nr:hypothetical protein [uncultured Methanosphaera sp.]
MKRIAARIKTIAPRTYPTAKIKLGQSSKTIPTTIIRILLISLRL